MPYLVRVSLHPVCLSAKCTNHSDTLDMHDFTTLFANTICLTPARRQKLYVDRAELALKLSRVFIVHFVRQRNLPYSSEETKTVCRSCRTCAEIKPRFYSRLFRL